MISILIPTYNDDCSRLISDLTKQAASLPAQEWELIVADDGSTDTRVKEQNAGAAAANGCRFIALPKNMGRAAVRNYLASASRGEHLLFIDADMALTDDRYLEKYLATMPQAPVIYGGYSLLEGPPGNLRYRWERAAAHAHTANKRNERPHHDFHSSNFMITRTLMRSLPFDERFRNYGYEDVFYGKQLNERGIRILHIDAPVGFCKYESNALFLSKTEESLRTLSRFQGELSGYSRLLQAAKKIKSTFAARIFLKLYDRRKNRWKHNLLSANPSLFLFKLYKLGFFLRIAQD